MVETQVVVRRHRKDNKTQRLKKPYRTDLYKFLHSNQLGETPRLGCKIPLL